MSDDELQAIEFLNFYKEYCLKIETENMKNGNYETVNAEEFVYKNLETVLNLIEKQQREKELHIKLEQQYKKEYLDAKEENEKKDKIISNLEFALMDMVLQFADENKDSINTMGLSALETAFNELNFDNPISIKEVHKRYKELAQKYYQ